MLQRCVALKIFVANRPWGGGLPYERGGDVRRNFWIEPLKETNLGVAEPFLTPKKTLIIFNTWIEQIKRIENI